MSDAKYSNPIELEITEPHSFDEQAAVALVIAGALVAVADRRVSPVERDEVIRFIRERGLAPHITDERLFAMFDELAERLEEPDFANVVIDTLRPVADLPLSSHLIELSERVAAADEDVHPHEVQAIKLLRLLTLFQSRSSWAGADLTSRLEVTARTLRRDVITLIRVVIQIVKLRSRQLEIMDTARRRGRIVDGATSSDVHAGACAWPVRK